MLFLIELKLCSALWSVDMVYVGELVLVFWGRGPLLWFSGTLAQKSSPCRVQVGRAWCKWFRLLLLVLCCLLKLAYAERQGREMVPAPHPTPQRGEFAAAAVREALLEEQTVSPHVS